MWADNGCTRGSGFKLTKDRFKLGIRKKFLMWRW